MKVDVTWKKNKAFEADVNGKKVMMDLTSEMGGENKGPFPKPLLLAALGGCSGLDVVAILNKMQVEIDDYSMSIEAHTTETHPQYYDKIHATYIFKGKNLDIKKLNRAVKISLEQYCGVAAMLKKAAELTFSVEVVEE